MKRFFANKDNKAFTLIELIAVIAILGVLVLIAVPNFLEQSRSVQGKEIAYNIKIVEYNSDMYKLNNDIDIIDGLPEINPEDIQAAFDEKRLFDSNGYASIDYLDGFYDLSDTTVVENVNTSIDGVFAKNEEDIFFISNDKINPSIEYAPDTEPPVITIGSYDTEPTNGNITICATTNEGYLNEDCHTFTENDTFGFIATDVSGNKTTETVTVDFIDKTPPVITINPYITDPTNQDIIVSASIDDGTFTSADNHTFSENGSFAFTAVDAVGNISEKTVAIGNIDKIPPATPVFNVDVVGGTGTVTITYSADSATKQYKVDSGVWTDYTAPVILTNNATVYAKGTDAAGNESIVTDIDVIVDTTPPVVTFATNGNATPMKTQSTVINVVDDGSGVDASSLQYAWSTSAATPGTGWASFSDGDTISHGGVTGSYYLHVKASDVIGNAGEYITNSFTIDNTPPIITIGSYQTTPTNQNIIVTAATNEGTLNAASYTFSTNGSYLFTATDEAGNMATHTVNISNIDKIAPVTPTLTATANSGNAVIAISYSADSTIKQYKIGTGSWIDYTSPITLSSTSTIYARGRDIAGNYSTEESGTATVSAKTVSTGEGPINDSTLSVSTNIEDLLDVRNVSVNTGSSTHTKTGTSVTVNTSGGTYSRRTRDSMAATSYTTSSSNSFALTKSYTSGEYSGTLSKDGTSFVSSGVYTPADTKYVTAQTSSSYNVGGYVGTLSSYVYSTIPGDSKTVTYTKTTQENITYYRWQWSTYWDSYRWDHNASYDYEEWPSSVYVSSGDYKGRIYYYSKDRSYRKSYSPPSRDGYNVGELAEREYMRWDITYRGLVYLPDTNVYRYRGNVTKPATDTRVYRQNYSGTAYTPYDYYYNYTATIDFIAWKLN